MIISASRRTDIPAYYNGATQSPSIVLALAGMAAVILATMVILLLSHPGGKVPQAKKKLRTRCGQRRRTV